MLSPAILWRGFIPPADLLGGFNLAPRPAWGVFSAMVYAIACRVRNLAPF